MIRVTYFIVCLLLGITLVSCIRDEALNAEADILTCTVSGLSLIHNLTLPTICSV